MSPILVRPVREQFEHDRVIRVLHARYKRKFEVAMNPGVEQNGSVSVNDAPMFPDLVLYSQDKNRKVVGTVEVETTESINTLEAMAEWGPFSRLKVPFHLYVPPNAIDTARRLCTEHQIVAAEIWTYVTSVDQVRFTLVDRSDVPPPAKPAARPAVKDAKKPAAARKASATKKPAAPARAAAARKPARPAKPAKAAKKPAPKAARKAASARPKPTASAKRR